MTLPVNRKRSSSVSYNRGDNHDDEIHVTLAPYVQTYLAREAQGSGCCGIGLPVPFERAAPRSWWNPKFDSKVLEEQYRQSAFPQIRLRFRYALTYILLVSLSWLAYFVTIGVENETGSWPAIAVILSAVGVSTMLVLYFTCTEYYRCYILPTSVGVALMLCLSSLVFLASVPPDSDGLTLVGHFALSSEILLLIYTVVPMPLYACVGICASYSILFEALTAHLYNTGAPVIQYTDEIIPVEFDATMSRTTRGGGDYAEQALPLAESLGSAHFDEVSGGGAVAGGSKLLSSLGAAMLDGRNVVAKAVSRALEGSNVLTNLSNSSVMLLPTVETTNGTTVSLSETKDNDSPILLSGPTSPSNATNATRYFDKVDFSTILTIRILMQICIHIIGVHILIMTFVRMRGTFMKVGQSLLVRRQLEMEKQLKEKMIHSVMPPKVADWLMEESEREREREDSLKKGSIPSNNTDIRSLFRPFNMHSMEDVSILFADIVGFTRMSSNKTAEELVGILNDLFERFDDLCEHHGCEKISTLGDCYYCVSGCPEPREDHAKCCVEMGLAMIEAIKQFDVERREGVNMRVGVHTGTVLCGIVGTKRFKFDVWSNDVTLANKLESTGEPGRVHLSESTLRFLGDEYLTEDGDTVNGVRTYFVKGRKADLVTQFVDNIVDTPTSASPLMHARHRVASCNNQLKPRHHYLHMVTSSSSYRIKANSLPSILDSENDEGVVENENGNDKSPTSTASYGKKKVRNKRWRYLQRQRTTEEMSPLDVINDKSVAIREVKPNSPAMSEKNRNVFGEVPVRNGIEMDPDPVPSSPLLCGQEPLSHGSSICSRKDSGIRSNSRRSSIQQQIFVMNGMAQGDFLGHRVSGYYTSSSTLNSTQEPSSSSAAPPMPPTAAYPFPPSAVTDTFGACFHKLRKQSDLQLIRCVQDNVTSQRSYFVKPPLSGVTLFFKSKEMEKEYRENAHRASEGIGGNPPTLATSRFNTYFDILVSALVYSAITTSLFLLCEPTAYFAVFCALATATQAFVVILCVRQLFNPRHATYTQNIFKFFSRWYPWHACGAVLVGLPIISILINFSCNSFRSSLDHFEYYYSYLVFVGLVHFCNFTQLNCWMKNLLVALAGLTFICLVASHVSSQHGRASLEIGRPALLDRLDSGSGNEILVDAISSRRFRRDEIDNPPSPIAVPDDNAAGDDLEVPKERIIVEATTTTMKTMMTTATGETSAPRHAADDVHRQVGRLYNERLYDTEIFLDMLLLLLLVWFLNREFEISYRLSFHGNAVAARDKTRVQSMKNQADWLLHNIIPKYVADQLKTTAKYSQNHKSVGIIFASIVNFNELYDESYLGGKEYLRVLNELIGDFDELLEKPEFSNVEKIKTIGSTFMAASGLNPEVRRQSQHEYQHLFQLMDFAVAMHKVIYDFNRDLLGFKLTLRVGYNYGDVTAGVIGATKLYYDIWGDAVNIASRMDSTGVAGRIQLASNSLDVLSEKYQFEPRGSVYVKGKDHMNVFLLTGKKDAAVATVLPES